MQVRSRRNFINFLEPPRPRADGYWLHVGRPAMGCRFEITLPLSEHSGVLAATEALDEIDLIEAQLTVFRDNSEVSCLNARAATETVQVESSLFNLLRVSQSLYRETGGAFDITSGPLTRAWGFLRRNGRLPTHDELEQARAFVGSDKMFLRAENRTVRFAQAGVEINLGSIGKGYALDRVSGQLRARVTTALVNAGGSSICAIGSGAPRDGGWIVGLRHPRNKETRLAVLQMRDCALATSGSEEQFFELDGRRYGHIIDPRSGVPASEVTSVTVVSDSATLSDALATAFYVGGRKLAERYCEDHPRVLVIMLEDDAEDPILIGSNEKCECRFQT